MSLEDDHQTLLALLVTVNMHRMHDDFALPLRRALWLMERERFVRDAMEIYRADRAVPLGKRTMQTDADYDQAMYEALTALSTWEREHPMPMPKDGKAQA